MRLFFITLFISIGASASNIEANYRDVTLPANYGTYYDWGTAVNGWGYCYQYASTGQVLNGGRPVPNYNCEYVNPSRVSWGLAVNGWGYCFQRTPYGVPMNEGRPVDNYNCEQYYPSHYAWGTAVNGNTYCYQRTPEGYTLNVGKPVQEYLCY